MADLKTTVYLSKDLKAALERAATISKRSEAELIREGVRRVTAEYEAPEPRLPLFDTGDPTILDDLDGMLRGFGED